MTRLGLLLALLLAALPADALAGTVERGIHRTDDQRGGPVEETGEITYTATAGQANAITVRLVAGALEITDDGGADAGAGGCAQSSPQRVVCADSTRLILHAGDGADVVDIGLTVGAVRIEGGDGHDRLTSHGAVFGGPGNDLLRSTGAAALNGGPGSDEIVGGPGQDYVSYFGETRAVHADLDGDADDGPAGERDRIDAAIEGIAGGSGDDELAGDDRPNRISGGPGADRVRAGGGDDQVDADSGDRADMGAGDDHVQTEVLPSGAAGLTLAGGPGRDRLEGSPAADTIAGGAGRDTVIGLGGADVIDVVDGELDDVFCERHDGSSVRADVTDLVVSCADIARPGTPRIVLRAFTARRLELQCPPDHGSACAARLRLTRAGRLVHERTLALPRGRRGYPEWRRYGRRLRPGRYVLRLASSDAAGRPFTIVRALRVRPR